MIVTTKEEKLNLYRFARANVQADNARGGCCLDDERLLVESFYDVLDAYEISVKDFEKELNERHVRMYVVRQAPGKREMIYIYFKDCFYLLVDENMHQLLLKKLGEI